MDKNQPWKLAADIGMCPERRQGMIVGYDVDKAAGNAVLDALRLIHRAASFPWFLGVRDIRIVS